MKPLPAGIVEAAEELTLEITELELAIGELTPEALELSIIEAVLELAGITGTVFELTDMAGTVFDMETVVVVM